MSEIRKIINTCKTLQTEYNVTPCIKYLSSKVFPMDNGQHFILTRDGFMIYDITTIKQVLFNKLSKKLSKWYFEDNENVYTLIMDPKKPLITKHAINTFEGFKHTDRETKPTDKDINGVNMMLEFINDVICSGNKDLFNYVLKFLANIAHGNKNQSCLYLKGPQGIGKSTLTTFLINHVYGDKICINSNADPLLKGYNRQLMGKILVVFEELPTFSKSEWNGVSSVLKDMITADKQHYNEKYLKSVYVDNLNNYIINTNTEAIKDSNGRRYCILDLSTQYQGKHKYFSKLYDICFNDNVGRCFYNYLLGIDISNFNSQGDMPITSNKMDAYAELLPLEYKFLKHEYLFKNIGINTTVDTLYKQYENYCSNNGKNAKGKILFCKKLKEINLNYYKSNGSNKYRVSHSTLLNISNKQNWVHDLDNYRVKKFTKQERLDEITTMVTELKREYKQLLKLKDGTVLNTMEKSDDYFNLE